MTQTTLALDEVSTSNPPSSPRLTLRWALKRALLGISILVIGVGGLAWLTHAAIDQNSDANAATAPAALTVTSQPMAAH